MRIKPFWNVADFEYPRHRGETRWIANWLQVFSAFGYEVSNSNPDLILGVPWENNAQFKDVPHIHLRFGPMTKQCVPHLQCFGDKCKVAAPYRTDARCEPEMVNNVIFMPIPYLEEWLPQEDLTDPLSRREILWAAKEIFHPELGQRSPHIPQCGIWTLEAIADLSKELDLSFTMIECAERGSSLAQAPDAAKIATRGIKNFKRIEGSQRLTELIRLFSHGRISLPVGGALGSTVEAVFAGCTPLAHKGGPLGDLAMERGFSLPRPQECTKEDIYSGLKQMFDDEYYQKVHACYQKEFEPHFANNAIAIFEAGL